MTLNMMAIVWPQLGKRETVALKSKDTIMVQYKRRQDAH